MSCFDEGTGNTFDLNRIQIAPLSNGNRGRVVTKAMLLEQLWDIDGNFVDDNTVRVNIKRLRQKLNDEKQEYIVTVLAWATLLENDDEAFCDL